MVGVEDDLDGGDPRLGGRFPPPPLDGMNLGVSAGCSSSSSSSSWGRTGPPSPAPRLSVNASSSASSNALRGDGVMIGGLGTRALVLKLS